MNYEIGYNIKKENYESNFIPIIIGGAVAIGAILKGLNVGKGGRKAGKAAEMLAAKKAQSIEKAQKIEKLKKLNEIKIENEKQEASNKSSKNINLIIIISVIIIGLVVYFNLRK